MTVPAGRVAGTLLALLVLAWDIAVVLLTPLAVRGYIVARLAVGVDAPQWGAQRYLVAGAVGAAVYLVWAWSLRYFDATHPAEPQKIPLSNLGAVAVLACLGLYACWQYGMLFETAQLMARRVVFLACLGIYAATTFAHYAFATIMSRMHPCAAGGAS